MFLSLHNQHCVSELIQNQLKVAITVSQFFFMNRHSHQKEPVLMVGGVYLLSSLLLLVLLLLVSQKIRILNYGAKKINARLPNWIQGQHNFQSHL